MKGGTLKLNYETGEGSLQLVDFFKECDGLTRADVLKDWIGILEQEYEHALQEMRMEHSQLRIESRRKDWESEDARN